MPPSNPCSRTASINSVGDASLRFQPSAFPISAASALLSTGRGAPPANSLKMGIDRFRAVEFFDYCIRREAPRPASVNFFQLSVHGSAFLYLSRPDGDIYRCRPHGCAAVCFSWTKKSDAVSNLPTFFFSHAKQDREMSISNYLDRFFLT